LTSKVLDHSLNTWENPVMLQKLQMRPGINREGTTLANEGGWFECDNIRFRSGFPEKLGGWVKDGGAATATLAPPSGSFWGVCRSMWNWNSLAGANLLALGTNLKYYIQNGPGGNFYDITPLRDTATGVTSAFTVTNGSNVVTVTDAGHGAQTGDFVTITYVGGAIGGMPAAAIAGEHQITYISSSQYSFVATSVATSNAGPSGTADFAYQITTGSATYTVAAGWGAGGWGGSNTGGTSTGWGQASSTGGVGQQLRLWSEANYGENLIFSPRGGALYYWDVNANPNIFDRGVIMAAGTTVGGVPLDSTTPSIVNHVMVSDASRFVICFGTNDPSGVYFPTAQDPLLIRWSNQEDYGTWIPAITNQAGDYRLSSGSEIIATQQTRQEILVFTDAAIYSMQYLGPPYVWGFQIMGENISIAGPNVVTTSNNVTYWMGADKFYMYSGRVETLPCALRQYVYEDINMLQSFQFFAGTNEGYNEIWWFYCSANSDVIDKYVIFNHLERTWYYGNMERTAWLDSPLREQPMATFITSTGDAGALLYHETGNDDGTTNPPSPIVSYCQSSDFDIGDGHNFGLVSRIIPDVTFDGSDVAAPTVTFGVRPRQNPGANYGRSNNPDVVSVDNYLNQRYYNVQQFTQYVYVRVRGRQMAFRIGSDDLGVAWQLGAPRIEIRPDGRR
jgi:hypothetical protein